MRNSAMSSNVNGGKTADAESARHRTRSSNPLDNENTIGGDANDYDSGGNSNFATSATETQTNRPCHGDDMLVEPEELRSVGYVIHSKLKIILCKECKTIVLPKRARKHINKETHVSIPDPGKIGAMDKYVKKHKSLLTAEQISHWIDELLERQKAGTAISQIPILPVFKDGFKCANCGFVTGNKELAYKHVKHSGCHAAMLTNIPLQRLGNGDKLKKYIHVDVSSASRRDSAWPASRLDRNVDESTEGELCAAQPQKTLGWIEALQWDLLLDRLRQSGYQEEILAAVEPPTKSASIECWLIRRFMETIFEMEQQEVAERNKAYTRVNKHNAQIYDIGLQELIAWRRGRSADDKQECILAAVRMVYGLVQLNKNPNHAKFLSQPDDLHQAILDLLVLVDRITRSLGSNISDETDLMHRIDDDEYFAGLLYTFKVMKLLWMVRTEDEEPNMRSYMACRLLFLLCWKKGEPLDPTEVISAIEHMEFWARLTVDIHLQLQLSAWKEHAALAGDFCDLDAVYLRIVTDLWWGVLEASPEGADEQRRYLKMASRQSASKSKPARLIERSRLYLGSSISTPFGALQIAKDTLSDGRNRARRRAN